MAFEIPEQALSERYLAATGPGGQNVNKVATAVQLRVDVAALGLPPSVAWRLVRLAGRRMNLDGSILIVANRFRTRESNRADARERLQEMIDAACVVQAPRRPTRPGKGAIKRRLEAKSGRADVKARRRKPVID